MCVIIRPLLLFFLLLLSPRAWSQTYPVNGGDVSTCSGALLDSGGPGGSGYSDNEHFIITICSPQPDSAISLSFIIFNLSAAGSLPTDELSIYDGNSTSAPLIGTWSGTDSPGIVNASFANTSGCLTVEFTSNETGTGVFAASITCSHPCEPPTAAAVMGEPAPALICQGEELHFDGSGSYAANPYSIIQYMWDFGDGTMDSTSGPVVDHVFAGPPAQRIVHLTVTDNNGCRNTNPVDLPVQISTTPTFSNFGNITICQGESVDLTAATHVEGTTWTSIPDANFGGGLALPDDIGTPFNSSLNFSAFPPGAVINSVGDILSVCVSMEHSFLGDFVLKLTAPNGTVLTLHEQGGGGTYVGGANDLDGVNPVPGECWDYCFSPTATWGTWANSAAGGSTPHVMMGGNPPSNALVPGTYSAVGSFNSLVGSPLNGTWTLTFTDIWQIDNGSICSWGINFDPAILPPDVSYTPTPGIAHSDSSYWTGPELTNDPANPLHYVASPSSVGNHTYNYTVTDNFGCTYDTTLIITVTPGVNFNATSSPPAVCGNPIILQPGLQLPLPLGTITYQWSPGTGLSSTSSPYPTASPPVPTWYTLHAFPAGHPLCGNVDSVLVNPLTTMANDSAITNQLCHGDGNGSVQVITAGTGGPWNYVWTDSSGTVVQQTIAANGDVFNGSGGTYQVVISEGPNGNGCTDSLIATILEPPPLLITSASLDTVICLTGTATLAATAAGGTGVPVMHWDQGAGPGSPATASPSVTTTYNVYATDANNCLSDTGTVTVTVRKALALFLPDTVTSCPEVNALLFTDSVTGGDGQYTYDWGAGPSLFDTMTVNLLNTQTFCVTLRDGCETPPVTECTVLSITPLPPFVLSVDSVLGCKPFNVQFALEDTTGWAVVDWDFHDGPVLYGFPTSMPHLYSRFGTYDLDVNVHWPNGCSFDSTLTNLITVVDMPHADFTWAPQPADIFEHEVHFTEQCGPTAVSYLWDIAGMASSTAPDTSFDFPDDIGRLYPVKLKAWNYLGCADSVMKMVNVDDAFLVFVPTAFSPDGDGLNEILYVIGNDISDKDFHFMVFDRWGEKIYDTTDRNAGWDGKMNGKVVKNGVYTWMLRAQSVYTGVNHDLMGHVTVVR